MSQYVHSESFAPFAESRSFSWRALFRRMIDTVQAWRRRHRERRELSNYLAMDHRAAADIRIDRNCARKWVERPFWQL